MRALFLLGLLGAAGARAAPVLRVQARTRIDVSSIERIADGLRIRGALVDVALGQPIAGETVALLVAREDGAPQYRYAAPTGSAGTFDFRVPLPLGQYRLSLGMRGDDYYGAAASVERQLDVARRNSIVELSAPEKTPTVITLDASASELSWRGVIAFTGQLTSPSGAVENQPVTLFVQPAQGGAAVPSSTARTNGQGGFSIPLPGGRLPPGDWFVEARFEASASSHESSRSSALAITQLAPAPLSSWFYLSPGAIALGFGLIGRLRKGARGGEPKPRRWGRPRGEATAVGFAEGPRRRFSGLRAAADFGISGQVVGPSGEPVAGAEVRLRAGPGGGTERTLEVDERGGFAIEELPEGPLTVDVVAPYFVPERFERMVPHRGELRGTRIHLLPIRSRIFALYRAATVPLHAAPALADVVTPRELLVQVSRRRLFVDPLAALTDLVEESCFSPRAPDASALARALRLAAEVGGSPASGSMLDPPRDGSL